MLKNIREISGNLANARYRKMSGKMCIFASLINPIPNRLSKKLKEKHIFIIKLLVLIFHDGIVRISLKSAKVCSNGRRFAQTGESLLKQACIAIIVVCDICLGPMSNQGK